MKPSKMLRSYRGVRPFLSLSAWIALGYLGGCSLNNFDYLQAGETSASGGSTQAASGGSGTTSASTSGGADGLGGSEGTGGTTASDGCDAGLSLCTEESVCADLVHGEPAGATVSHCGTCDVTCSLANAKSATCAEGKCTPACSPNFADCNDSALNDGCEVYLNGLTSCGTDCTNGVACAANQVCNAGSCSTPQGLVVLSVPFTTAGQSQRYAYKFLSLPDLTDDTLILRMYAPGATGGSFVMYMTDADFSYGTHYTTLLGTLSAGWTDVSVPVGGVNDTYNPGSAYQITLEVTTGSDAAWANPTVIYIDSIRSVTGTVMDTFDTSISAMINSSMMKVEGSTLGWLSAIP